MLLYFGVILCFFVELVYNLEMITVIFLGHFAISSCIFSLLVVVCVRVWGF